MAKRKTIAERMDEAIAAFGGPMPLDLLEATLYPDPRSHRYQANGGPPGCRMAVMTAVRRHGFYAKPRPGAPGIPTICPRKERS